MKYFIVIGIKNFNDLYYKIEFKNSVEGHKKQLEEAISYYLDIFIQDEIKTNAKNRAESFYRLGQFIKNEDIFDWRKCSLKTFNGKQQKSVLEFIIDLD